MEKYSASVELSYDLSSLPRESLFISYACCDIILRSKDRGGPYKSITRFINQLTSCTKIDGLAIRQMGVPEITALQEVILNLIYS